MYKEAVKPIVQLLQIQEVHLGGTLQTFVIYPFSPLPCSQGLGSSIGRTSHWWCVWVQSPLSPEILFPWKKSQNLYTSATVNDPFAI